MCKFHLHRPKDPCWEPAYITVGDEGPVLGFSSVPRLPARQRGACRRLTNLLLSGEREEQIFGLRTRVRKNMASVLIKKRKKK